MLTIESINAMTPAEFSAAFSAVYEHSPWIAERAMARRPFATRIDMHLALYGVVQAASPAEQLTLLNSHPELAGKEAQAGTMTTASVAEQQGAGLNALSHEEFVELGALNRRYLEQFGFPFIVCARLNSKAGIFGVLKARLTNSRDQERQNALAQVGEIARLRLLDIVQ